MNMVELREVAEFINGYAFKPADWNGRGKRIIRIQNLTDDSKPYNYSDIDVPDKYTVRKGNLLVSWSATLDVFEWNFDDQALLNQHIFKVEFKHDGIEKRYFKYILKDAVNRMKKFTHGSTMKHIVREDFVKTRIPLPPLSEQKRIANILDKADSLRQKRKESIALLDKLLKSVFIDMFGDPVRNEKGWERIELSKIVDNGDIKCGPFGSQLRIQEYIESGIPVYGIDNVQTNQFVDAKPKFITKEKYTQLKSFSVLPGDVLISRTGTVGRACIAPENVKFAVIGPNLMKVRVNINKLLPQFLSYSFNESTFIINQIRISSPGATVAVYNTKNLKKLILPVPPIELQASFANIMREIETLKNVNLQSLNEMNNQFNALLQRAFRGDRA